MLKIKDNVDLKEEEYEDLICDEEKLVLIGSDSNGKI